MSFVHRENAESISVRFWGVRGSIPTPADSHRRTGGNTACVEIQVADKTACILDLGTGAFELGRELVANAAGQALDVHVFLSHYHWDHIQAAPFFAPFYAEGSRVTLYGSDVDGAPLDLLRKQMERPFFPIGLDQLPASVSEVLLRPGQPVPINGLLVTPFPVHHTQYVFGYKLTMGKASVVYCTDYEHGDAELDELLADVALDADLLICDAQYTPAEYEQCVGWGHTTWEQAARVASRANVKRLALFHHDPGHDDRELDAILRNAQSAFPETVLATEGETLRFPSALPTIQ